MYTNPVCHFFLRDPKRKPPSPNGLANENDRRMLDLHLVDSWHCCV